MNRLSELQTIVNISKACNSKGLIKEADQLLNIFTKLAQENPNSTNNNQQDINDSKPEDKASEENKVDQEKEAQPETITPEEPEIDQELVDNLNEYITSSEKIFLEFTNNSTLEQNKQLLPEFTRLIDLSRTIMNNPNIDPANQKTISESLPEIIKIQETLKK